MTKNVQLQKNFDVSKEIDRIGRRRRGKKNSQFSLLLGARAGFWFKGCTYHEFDAWVIRAPKDFVVLDHKIAVNHVAVILHLLVHALHFVDGHRQSVCSPEAHAQGCCCDAQQQCPCSHRRFFPAAIIIAVAHPPPPWLAGSIVAIFSKGTIQNSRAPPI